MTGETKGGFYFKTEKGNTMYLASEQFIKNTSTKHLQHFGTIIMEQKGAAMKSSRRHAVHLQLSKVANFSALLLLMA